jgi:putative (di)nucleoside polyphosphate hydrolase
MSKKTNKILPPDYLYRTGVGIAIINQDKKIFVGHRIDSVDKLKSWQMPQGGVDAGEEELLAMFRELKEETGLEKDAVKILHQLPNYQYYNLPNILQKKLWGGKYLGQRQKWFLLELSVNDEAINIKTENPEFNDWQWVSVDEAIELIVDFKKMLYKEVFRGFAKFLN